MRIPAVSGSFYPSNPKTLKQMITQYIESIGAVDITPLSGVVPHAGYVYSGAVAAYTFKAMKNINPKTIVIIGPDHVGVATYKDEIAVYPDGSWTTPLGNTEVDSDTAHKIIDNVEMAVPDKQAHEREHSIEVQIPFIQALFPDAKIVPVMMGNQSIDITLDLGTKLSKIHNIFVLASSDMSHYMPVNEIIKSDKYALEALINMDAHEFYRRISERKVSACGYGPATVAMTFAKEKGSTHGEILDYRTSADVTGEETGVGYASVIFTAP